MSKVEKAIQRLRKIEAYVEGQRRSEVTLACDVVLAELEQLTAIAEEMVKPSWDAPMAHEMAKAWKEGTSNE